MKEFLWEKTEEKKSGTFQDGEYFMMKKFAEQLPIKK